MSNPRPGLPGAVRECPHCKESILESAAVCPACKHHVRFDASAKDAAPSTHTPLSIEGSFRNPSGEVPREYTVVVSIRNDRGQEIARKLIGVGAMKPDEVRSFSLMVEMAPGKAKAKPSSRH